MSRLGLAALIVGLLLRVVAAGQHQLPRGDVVLDVGVVRSLLAGDGFRAGFTRGVPLVVGQGTEIPPQGWADQHAPLWPLVGAALAPLSGDPLAALKLGSWLAGLALLALVWRCGERLTEGLLGAPAGLGALAAGLVALCFVTVDAAGNGSLYSAQAALVLLLVELLAGPRHSALVTGVGAGLLLGALALLNHQALVLAPLPLLQRLITARRGEGRSAWAVGLLALAVAALCLLPWWVRNVQLFGSPTHSVNGAYLWYRAGMVPRFGLEDGQPLMRLVGALSPRALARALAGFLRGNLIYLASTAPFVLPCLAGVLLAGLPGLCRAARARRDGRLIGLLLSLAALLAVSLLWPAFKLRYLVTLTPLAVLLGVRVLASPLTVGQRRWAIVVCAGWAVLLLATLDDLSGSAADARPGRWWSLALAGGTLVVLPLLWRLRQAGGCRGGRLVLLSGLPLALAGSLVMLLSAPGTGYHSTVFAPDAFGRHVERQRARSWEALERARQLLQSEGSQRVLGPVELLAWPQPALVELPRGAGAAILAAALRALLSEGTADHLVLSLAEARSLADEPLIAGRRWFGGRLELLALVGAEGQTSETGSGGEGGGVDDGEWLCVSRILPR